MDVSKETIPGMFKCLVSPQTHWSVACLRFWCPLNSCHSCSVVGLPAGQKSHGCQRCWLTSSLCSGWAQFYVFLLKRLRAIQIQIELWFYFFLSYFNFKKCPIIHYFSPACTLADHLNILSKIHNKWIWNVETIRRLNVCDRSDHAVLRGFLRGGGDGRDLTFCNFLFFKWL